jgi:hypothetical protein
MEKVDLWANGHLHPREKPRLDHFGGTIQFTGLATRETELYSLITFDNRAIGYHVFHPDAQNVAVLTMPVRYREMCYNLADSDIEVRVLAFTDADLVFNVFLAGNPLGVLARTREVKPGVWLWSMPLSVSPGVHTLRIDGALQTEVEFAVKAETEPFSFTQPTVIRCFIAIMMMVFAGVLEILWIAGMLLPASLFAPNDSWLFVTLLGPLVAGRHLANLPLYAKVALVVFALWGFCGPISFFSLEKTVGIMWVYSYVVDGTLLPEFICLLMAAVYCFFITPLFFNAFAFYENKVDLSVIGDVIIGCIQFAGGEWAWFTYGAATPSDHGWLSSFEFFIFPLVAVGLVAFVYWTRVKGRSESETGEVMDVEETHPAV